MKQKLLIIITLAALIAAIVNVGVVRADITDNLIAYWRLEEAGGQRLDTVGANHLADNNSVGSDAGVINDGALFNGTDNYLSVADNAALSVNQQSFTVSFFARVTDAEDFAWLVSKGSQDTGPGFDYSWSVYVVTGDVVFAASNGSAVVQTLALDEIESDESVFVVAWRDVVNDTINIQINNGQVHSAAVTDSYAYDDTEAFFVGGIPQPGYIVDGLIDEVSFWKRVLTQAERQQLYNGGFGCAHPFTDCLPVQDDLSWLEDGSFDLPQSEQPPPWEYVQSSQRSSGIASPVLSRANAYCGNTFAEIAPHYSQFRANADPDDYLGITGDPPVWRS
ncbi:MAG TPA: LamG-like jellyroll fold domain-containing protein, partial [Anaerolineae bacterium]